MAGVRAAVWPTVKSCIVGALLGVTITDRYAGLVTVRGTSMSPTFDPEPGKVDRVLVERLCLDRFDFSRGDVVVFRSPRDHRNTVVKRLIALPGDWVQVPEASKILQVPEGHCWVEGDNAAVSCDSRAYGPVPLGLMRGRVTHIIWPPNRIGRIDKKLPEGRIMPR